MSTPRSGVVEVFAGLPGLSDVSQGSGVLVAPDEVLTAAHVVDAADGVETDTYIGSGVSNFPQVSAFTASTVHIDPGFEPSADDEETPSMVVHDFALIHLAKPVSGMVYALGTTDGGTLTVGGYPVGTGSAYDEATEPFTAYAPILEDSYPGILNATPLGEGGDPHGSSGGPVMDLSGTTPTVVGLVQGSSSPGSGGTGAFVQLTAADVAEIQGWIAADHGQTPPSPAPAATVIPAPVPPPATVATPASIQPPAPTPMPTSSLEALAAAIARDAAVAPDVVRQTTMTDVANGLAAAADAGSPDIESGWSKAAAEIRGGSSAPRRALAFLGGLLSALDGTGRSGAASYASAMFPSLAAGGGGSLGEVAANGWAEMTKLTHTSPGLSAPATDLAASLAMPVSVGVLSPATGFTVAQAPMSVAPAHRYAA